MKKRLQTSLDGREKLVERPFPARGASGGLEESVEESSDAAKRREGGGEEGGRGRFAEAIDSVGEASEGDADELVRREASSILFGRKHHRQAHLI